MTAFRHLSIKRKLMLLPVLIEQHASGVLRLLHIWLVEWIDVEEEACRRSGNLPAQELRAERYEVGHLERRVWHVVCAETLEPRCFLYAD